VRVLIRERIILPASGGRRVRGRTHDSVLNDRRFTMPLPNISAAQVEWVIQQVGAYIERQRQTYIRKAVPLDRNQKTTMQPFFPESTLDSARALVLAGERGGNPPFYEELVRMGFEAGSLPNFAFMAAITFVDTVVFHEPFTERLLFHELVHVVQYEKLGLNGFTAKYVTGFLSGGCYEAIPLEMNAYELDGRFATEPTKTFSVAAGVQSWIDGGRF
jgi:hypothetical protein